MTRPFSSAVTALDEALIAEPVFKSEVGLAHRRVKLERAFAKALRAYFGGVLADSPSVDLERAVAALLTDLPESSAPNGILSKY